MKSRSTETSNYWVVKGNPTFDRWFERAEPGKIEDWGTMRYETQLKAGDRIFFWRSGALRKVQCLGEIINPRLKVTRDGVTRFEIRYLTPILGESPTIEQLRSTPDVRTASFLKRGAGGTLFPISESQAARLYGLIVQKNPDARIWPDLKEQRRRAGSTSGNAAAGSPSRRGRKAHEGKITTSDGTRAPVPPTDVSRIHAKMQEKLRSLLHRKYGKRAVLLERDYVDARVDTEAETILFEIKSDPTPREVIRQAMGQLLEYAYYHRLHGHRVLRLVAVGQSELGKVDEEYLRFIKKQFQLPIDYWRLNL